MARSQTAKMNATERTRLWRLANPERHKANNKALYARKRQEILDQNVVRRLKRYGLTKSTYSDMVQVQNGVCALCKNAQIPEGRFKNLVVDHSHTTGLLRGLLCRQCNRGLGCFKDSIHILRSA